VKKLLSILLLGIFFFSSVGYYGVFVLLSEQLNREMSQELDEDRYSGSNTMIVKIPMSLPYQANFNGYERAEGEFESEGKYYRIFKQQLVKDTLYIILVENKHLGELKKSMAGIAVANSSEAPSSNTAKILNTFCKDFVSTTTHVQSLENGWSRELSGLVPGSRYKAFGQPPAFPPPRIV